MLTVQMQDHISDLVALNTKLIDMNHRLEQTQGQLLQSEKMASIGQLAAGVAHEINNPVGYIASNLGTLRGYLDDLLGILAAYEACSQKIDPASEAAKNVRTARARVDLDYLRADVRLLVSESLEGVSRVKKIVQDLKEFAHVDRAEWQEADLHKGIDSTLNIVWNELKYKAEVVKEYGVLPLIECIPSQLNQVFMNLLINAAQAIESRGVITLRSGCDGERVWVEVADTGKGMSPDIQKRIFEPFFTTKPVGKGTGLGLSLAYGIVTKHNGEITVDSTVRRGTTFRVTLPVRRPPGEAGGAEIRSTGI
jgi:signal transduction histidine kinase